MKSLFSINQKNNSKINKTVCTLNAFCEENQHCENKIIKKTLQRTFYARAVEIFLEYQKN